MLNLQRRIKKVYTEHPEAQIVIYGKPGHAEVLGLVGQTNGTAFVVANTEEAKRLNLQRTTYLFSQTTKSVEGFKAIVDYLTAHILPPAEFHYADTICRRVAGRLPDIENFARRHDVIVFVAGKKSSNGRVLYEACRKVNPNAYHIEDAEELQREWFEKAESVGICGATSTPKWLMEHCAEHIARF